MENYETAIKIADEASTSLIECEFGREDAVTYSMNEDAFYQSEMLVEAVDYLVARGLAHRADADGEVIVIMEVDA